MLYATRVVGLLIWILLAALALKVMAPSGLRLAMASVLLLPMFIVQASASTDPLLNGLTVLYLAFVARAIYKKEVLTYKRAALLLAMLFVMVMAKPVYLAFGLLLLLHPVVQKGLKGYIYKAAYLAIPFILYSLWSVLTKDNGPPVYIESVAIGHAQPSVQAHYLVPNLLNFLQPLLNTLFLPWGDGVYGSVIGNFGKLDTPLPLLFIALGYALILIAVFARPDNEKEIKLPKTKYLNSAVLLTAVAFSLGVYLAMYVYSTPPGARIITGVQGRYFLPLIPLFVLFVSKNWVTVKKSAYSAALTIIPIVLIIASAAMVLLRFYATYP
jgi:uncharacterized membrane protein